MDKTFKRRLEALEALEAERYATLNPGPPTAEDCAVLLFQIAISNVAMRADGRAERRWVCGGDDETAVMDAALLRVNAQLAHESDPPRTTEEFAWAIAAHVPDEAMPLYVWDVLFKQFPSEEVPDAAQL